MAIFYVLTEWGGYVCALCVHDDPEVYLADYINSTKKAVLTWANELVEGLGFDCPESDRYRDSCRKYENGWYPGQNDTPEKCLEDMGELFESREWFEENFDWVFVITGVGQFDVEWKIMIRRKEGDE